MSTPTGPRPHPARTWRFTPTEVTVALVFAIVAVWSTLVVVVSLRQPVLGGDFMVFYTFGAAARLGDWAIQYDWPAFHHLHVSLGVVTVAICGYAAVATYVTTTLEVLQDTTVIEPKEEGHTHALRMSLEKLLPHDLATVAWLVASGIVARMLIAVWRRTDEWSLRIATLLLSTLLISPHVQTYDAILLAPAAL